MRNQKWIYGALALLVFIFLYWFIAYYFAGQALYPVWSGQSFDSCSESRKLNWGDMACQPEARKDLKYEDVSFKSANGYTILGWHFSATANRASERVRAEPAGRITSLPGSRAAFFVHGGGADRREGLRYAAYFLNRGFDYYLVDLGCHGQSPCGQKGLSFGDREHRDVLAIYRGLKDEYTSLVAYGTSVGATSILTALPDMPEIDLVIAENPMYGFRKFVMDTPAKPGFFPPFYMDYIAGVIFERGRFDGLATPANSLKTELDVPIFFLHGQLDDLIPVNHARDLCELHHGSKRLWISAKGKHARIKNHDNELWYQHMDAFLNGGYAPKCTD